MNVKYWFTILVTLLLITSGCSLFTQNPEVVKDGAQLTAELAEINNKNIDFLNSEWHKTLLKVIRESSLSPEEKVKQAAKADKLLLLIKSKADKPAQICEDLSKAVSAYLQEPGVELRRLIGLVQTATRLKLQ